MLNPSGPAAVFLAVLTLQHPRGYVRGSEPQPRVEVRALGF